MVAADARTALTFSLTPGQASDAPAGRELLRTLFSGLPRRCRLPHGSCVRGQRDPPTGARSRLDPGGPATRRLASSRGLYSKAWYRRRNEIERLFRRLKGFRRIFSRFDKLDVMFMAFLMLRAGRGGTAVVLTRPRVGVERSRADRRPPATAHLEARDRVPASPTSTAPASAVAAAAVANAVADPNRSQSTPNSSAPGSTRGLAVR